MTGMGRCGGGEREESTQKINENISIFFFFVATEKKKKKKNSEKKEVNK